MAKASSQKFIARNRAPRVQIEYDVELYGAEKKIQLPFVMGVLADLSGKPAEPLPPVADRKFLEVDVDNFDSRMKAMKPRVAFQVPNTLTGEGNLNVELTFESMDDFSPAAVAGKVDALNKLLQARQQLSNLITYMDGKTGAEELVAKRLQDPALLDRAIAERTAAGAMVRAVVAVDLYGQCCDYDALHEVCARHDVVLVQDAAESLGATYRGAPTGGQGALAAFSFNGNKIITTSGGGMLGAHDGEWIEHARKLSTQAREPVAHYEHVEVGFNYRMSNLLAALGRAQLESLPERVATRRRIRDRYLELLGDAPGLSFMPEASYGTSTFWLTCALVDGGPTPILERLERVDIEARPVWKPMHMQPVFKGARVIGSGVAERLFAKGICLPSGSNLRAEDRARVVAAIRTAGG